MLSLRLRVTDIFSCECAFVLFLFVAAYKSSPLALELEGHVDLTVLTMSISAVAGLAVLGRALTPPNGLQLGFAAAYVILILLAIGSYGVTTIGDQDALLKLQKLTVFNTFAVVVPLFLINSPERVERLLRLILTFAMVVSLQAVVGSRSAEDVRFIGAFGTEHYHALGHSSGIALVIVSSALLKERGRLGRFVLAGLAAIAAFALFLSSTRQALVAVFPALLILLPRFRRQRFQWRTLRRLLTVSACAVLLFLGVRDYFLAGTDLNHIWTRMLALFAGEGGDVIIESDRPVLWVDGVNLWLTRPFLGAGFGGFPIWGETGVRHPHNFFIELLAELGIVGLAIGAFLAGLAVFAIGRERRGQTVSSVATVRAVWVFLFSCAMLSGDLTDNRMMFAFMAFCLIRGEPAARRGRSDWGFGRLVEGSSRSYHPPQPIALRLGGDSSEVKRPHISADPAVAPSLSPRQL